MAMFRYIAVRLTIIALSSLMPFPKQSAAETKRMLQICNTNMRYCAINSEVKRYMYGNIAIGNAAKPRHVNNCKSFPTRL